MCNLYTQSKSVDEVARLFRDLQMPLVFPEGAWSTSDRKIVPPPREELDNSMESLIHHFKLHTDGYRTPIGEAYASTICGVRRAGWRAAERISRARMRPKPNAISSPAPM